MKKGFTLIELLIVVIILSILMFITIPIINNTLYKTKEKSKNETISNIIKVAENYIIENDIEYSSGEKIIQLEELKQAGYLPNKEYKDPLTNQELKGCISYKWEDKQYIINWKEECN